MRTDRAGTLARAATRLGRWSARVRDRVRGLPARWSHGGPPIPPARLLHAVGNSDDVAWFLAAGAAAADGLRDVLARNGVALGRLGAVLDFGCGVGRVLRHLHEPGGPSLFGTDYNRAMIAWCRANLPFARFEINGLDGPLPYQDATFDFIYAFSVFTHLAEPRQFAWIDELTRVLKPSGHLLLSTHGAHYLPQLDEPERARFRDGQLVVVGSRREGSNDCAAFHPEPYVRGTLARGLEVVDFLPEGARGNPRQDVWLLRKP